MHLYIHVTVHYQTNHVADASSPLLSPPVLNISLSRHPTCTYSIASMNTFNHVSHMSAHRTVPVTPCFLFITLAISPIHFVIISSSKFHYQLPLFISDSTRGLNFLRREHCTYNREKPCVVKFVRIRVHLVMCRLLTAHWQQYYGQVVIIQNSARCRTE